jgi:hypothetical protein
MSTSPLVRSPAFTRVKEYFNAPLTSEEREKRAYSAGLAKVYAGFGMTTSLMTAAAAALRTVGGGRLAPFVALAGFASSALSHEAMRVAENIEVIETEPTVRKTAMKSSELFVSQLTKNTICLPICRSTFVRTLNSESPATINSSSS